MKCPKCRRDTLRMKVDMSVDVPASYFHRLRKESFRKPDVRIDAVAWGDSVLYCDGFGCDYVEARPL